MKNKWVEWFVKGMVIGVGISVGLTATTLIAISISATFTAGDTLTANSLNVLKNALESIPGWSKGTTTTDAVYLDGNVGIGISNPTEKLMIADDGDADFNIWTAEDVSSDTSSIHFMFSRGTTASPSIVQPGDSLGYVKGRGYDGVSDFLSSASVAFYVDPDGTVSDTSMPGMIKFATAPDGTTSRSTRMTIREDGAVGVGSSSPSSILYVDTDPGDNMDALKIRQEDTSYTQDALDILMKKRRKDGTWPVQAKHAGKVHFDMEQTGGPSRWNTLRVLRVLKHFGVSL